jgi:hypothetical protein
MLYVRPSHRKARNNARPTLIPTSYRPHFPLILTVHNACVPYVRRRYQSVYSSCRVLHIARACPRRCAL